MLLEEGALLEALADLSVRGRHVGDQVTLLVHQIVVCGRKNTQRQSRER